MSYLVSLDAIWFCLISFSEEDEELLGHLVGVLSAHIGDDSPSVRRLCVKGLVQVTLSFLSSSLSFLFEDPIVRSYLVLIVSILTFSDMCAIPSLALFLVTVALRLEVWRSLDVSVYSTILILFISNLSCNGDWHHVQIGSLLLCDDE